MQRVHIEATQREISLDWGSAARLNTGSRDRIYHTLHSSRTPDLRKIGT
jgi:hypothetical protein